MTVGRLTLREERSRTVKASERVAQDIASGDADASQAMMAEHVERQHEYLRTRSPARIEEYIQWR
jgi:DNA-binding GntR family transcriptional regulator